MRPKQSYAAICAITAGTSRPGKRCWKRTPTVLPCPAPRPRHVPTPAAASCRICGPTGSWPSPQGRPCITTFCNSPAPRSICRNCSAWTWPKTFARNEWSGAAATALPGTACQARGIIEKSDQVRSHVLKNPSASPRATVETILALYPPKEKMAGLMRADAKRFQEAVAKTGAPLSATEPIAALAQRFESEMDLSLSAAEAWVTSAHFLKALERFPHLAKELGPLRVEGGTVQRRVYVHISGVLVQALRLGEDLLHRGAAFTRLVGRGHSLLATGDATGALKLFTEDLDLRPCNPRG